MRLFVRLLVAGPGKDRVIGADAGGFETGGGGGIIAADLSADDAEDKALELDRSLEADVVF